MERVGTTPPRESTSPGRGRAALAAAPGGPRPWAVPRRQTLHAELLPGTAGPRALRVTSAVSVTSRACTRTQRMFARSCFPRKRGLLPHVNKISELH